ncbi:MAG: hypothetical protein HYS06_12390 [Methylocystis sp.]|nr:hypothetical protein [Methylocystis sp.]
MKSSPSNFASDGAPARMAFRVPIGARLLTLFGVLALGGVSAFLTFVAVFFLLVLRQWAFGALVVAPVACFIAGLAGYGVRDLRGKWGLRVTSEADSLVLDLPAGRSLIHHPAAQHAKIPYAEVEAIESRLEAYGSLGMGMMQRAYVLRRKDGELIFLFEDRAIGTPFESSLFPRLAADIAARANVPLRDHGMVEGGGGFLGVWGAQAPDWAAPPLPLSRQYRIWREVVITGVLPIPIILIALLVRLLSG